MGCPFIDFCLALVEPYYYLNCCQNKEAYKECATYRTIEREQHLPKTWQARFKKAEDN